MSRRPAFMLYKGDWKRDPQLSMCCAATRGIWIDLMCDMDDLGTGTVIGPPEMFARMCRASKEEIIEALRELQSTGAADVMECQGIFTVTCRRIDKEHKTSDIRSEAGRIGGKAKANTLAKGVANDVAKSYQNAEDEYEEVLDVDVVVKNKSADLQIYGEYPRKVGRGFALKAISTALKRLALGELEGLSPGDAEGFLLAATQAFARSPAGNNGAFTPHPATWFNQARYLDEQSEWHRKVENGNSKGKTESSLDSLAQARANNRARFDDANREAGSDHGASGEAGHSQAGEVGGDGLRSLDGGPDNF